jgi:hypothetical protein
MGFINDATLERISTKGFYIFIHFTDICVIEIIAYLHNVLKDQPNYTIRKKIDGR